MKVGYCMVYQTDKSFILPWPGATGKYQCLHCVLLVPTLFSFVVCLPGIYDPPQIDQNRENFSKRHRHISFCENYLETVVIVIISVKSLSSSSSTSSMSSFSRSSFPTLRVFSCRLYCQRYCRRHSERGGTHRTLTQDLELRHLCGFGPCTRPTVYSMAKPEFSSKPNFDRLTLSTLSPLDACCQDRNPRVKCNICSQLGGSFSIRLSVTMQSFLFSIQKTEKSLKIRNQKPLSCNLGKIIKTVLETDEQLLIMLI